MPEWLNGTVSKTVVGLVSTEGSNPSLPAEDSRYESGVFLCEASVKSGNIKFILWGMALLMTVSSYGCSGNSTPLPGATSLPTDTVPASATVPAPEPTAVIDPAPVSGSIDQCKVGPAAFTNVGLGMPIPTHKLPTVGTVRTAVLFADFIDVPAVQTPDSLFSMVSPNAEKFFNDISYGKMIWVLEPHFGWLRLSQPSASYGEGIRSYEGHLQFIQEAVEAADAGVDFSHVDSVIVMVPPKATAIGHGPAFGANPGAGFAADGRIFENGVTSGADLPGWDSSG